MALEADTAIEPEQLQALESPQHHDLSVELAQPAAPAARDPAPLRAQAAALVASTRRLQKENRSLKAELRRATALSAIAGRLHHVRVLKSVLADPGSTPSLHGELTPLSVPVTDEQATDEQPSSQTKGNTEIPDCAQLQQRILEAQQRTQQYEVEAEAIWLHLRTDEDLAALQAEVARMRPLAASQGNGARKGWELRAAPSQKAAEAPSDTDAGPAATATSAVAAPASASVPAPAAATPDSSELCLTDETVLNSEPSFEMLATMAEADLVDEKKALQRRTSELEREVSALRIKAARFARTDARRRHQRRLQQAGVIAARMHEELQRRSGTVTPQSPGSYRFAGSDGFGVATPVESVSEISPVTQQSTDGVPSAGARSAAHSGTGRSSLASSSMGKVSASSSYRQQQINCQIKALSRRFVMRRDMR